MTDKKVLSEEDIAEYKSQFNEFDKNGDGVIDIKELRGLFNSLGVNPNDEEMKDLLHQFDIDNNGSIDFAEFLNFMNTLTADDEPAS